MVPHKLSYLSPFPHGGLHHQEELLVATNLPLPSVHRGQTGDDVDASGGPVFDKNGSQLIGRLLVRTGDKADQFITSLGDV